MRNTMKLRSGAVIREVTRKEADAKNYLTRNVLTQMHLMPSGDPCAYEQNEDGSWLSYEHTYHLDGSREDYIARVTLEELPDGRLAVAQWEMLTDQQPIPQN